MNPNPEPDPRVEPEAPPKPIAEGVYNRAQRRQHERDMRRAVKARS